MYLGVRARVLAIITGRTHNDDFNAEDHKLTAKAVRHAFKGVLGSCIRLSKGGPILPDNDDIMMMWLAAQSAPDQRPAWQECLSSTHGSC